MALPEWVQGSLGEDLFEQFESEHPGVQVHVAYFDGMSGPYTISSAAFDLEDHLQKTQSYVRSADILYVNWSGSVPVEATRAGYWLNMAPLTLADPALNSEDFWPAAWQSVQWDGGVWALPFLVDPQLWIYDASAFDAMGLGYPGEQWGIADIVNVARLLTQLDNNGNVVTPGMMVLRNQKELLLRSLLSEGVFDDNVNPSAPSLINPELALLLDSWMQMEEEGITGKTFAGALDQLPLTINTSQKLRPELGEMPYSAALLPGNVAGLRVDGLAVSGYTAYPELAYELAKYLTSSPMFLNSFLGGIAARQSLSNITPTSFLSPENQEIVNHALFRALPLSELRYTDYVLSALNSMSGNGINSEIALSDAQALAVKNMQISVEQRGNVSGVVESPASTALSPGEVSLVFGITVNDPNSIDVEQLTRVAEKFATVDPDVGQIVFSGGETFIMESDCFYLASSSLSQQLLGQLLNLDPLLDADPEFDQFDLVDSVLEQVSSENRVWGYPLTIQPYVLWYNSQQFDALGIAPSQDWTITDFLYALQTLKSNLGIIPFRSQPNDSTYLHMLIAAYGGLPLDYRVNPPFVNATDPIAITAVQQVLDLAKSGYITYEALDQEDQIGQSSPIWPSPFNSTVLSANTSFRPTLFPQGSQYTPISYTVGVAYINANTPYPDACYRWISNLAQHVELFPAMPARYSMINDAIILQTHGQDAVDLYNQVASLLQSPETVTIPPLFTGSLSWNDFLVYTWLENAYDKYVLQDRPLADGLGNFEAQVEDYRNCLVPVEPSDPANLAAYFEAARICAFSVDPSLEVN